MRSTFAPAAAPATAPQLRVGEGKERHHLVPSPAPSGHHAGELLSPRASLKGIELGQCRLGAGGRIDRKDGRGLQLSVFPAGLVRAVADQVHIAGLCSRGGRKHRAWRLGQLFEPSGDGYQHVTHAARREVVEHFTQNYRELGAFDALDAFDPQAQNVPATVGLHAELTVAGGPASGAGFAWRPASAQAAAPA